MKKSNKQQKRDKKVGKRTRQKKERRKRPNRFDKEPRPWAPIKMKFVQMPELVPADLTRDQRIELIRSIGSKATEEFEEKYLSVEKWFEEYDALYLLSFCAFYFVAHREGIDPEVSGRLDFPHHLLEIMQAFALYQQKSGSIKPLSRNATRLQEEMREIGDLMSIRLLKIPPELSTSDEIDAYRLRTEMMVNTTALRNWA